MVALRYRTEIAVGGETVAGTILTPEPKVPGLLFVHGWGGSQEQDLERAQAMAALGYVCLTFDLRGHALTEAQHHTVTREDNLQDLTAAYDALAREPLVDRAAIAVVGSSYGGYLATLLTTIRSVRWLALRVPALYRDEEWDKPKRALDREEIAAYRRGVLPSTENRALAACSSFRGDVLVVESENDELVPHQTILSFVKSFSHAHSLTYRVIDGADHALTDERCRESYSSILGGWATEMIRGARTA
jgi:uncharacterized protein